MVEKEDLQPVLHLMTEVVAEVVLELMDQMQEMIQVVLVLVVLVQVYQVLLELQVKIVDLFSISLAVVEEEKMEVHLQDVHLVA